MAAPRETRPPSLDALRAIDRHRDRTSAADIDALDPCALGVAQADRIGTLGERAVLPALDEREAAAAGLEELGRVRAIGMLQAGPGEEHEAWLVIAGGGHHRVVASRAGADIAGQFIGR